MKLQSVTHLHSIIREKAFKGHCIPSHSHFYDSDVCVVVFYKLGQHLNLKHGEFAEYNVQMLFRGLYRDLGGEDVEIMKMCYISVPAIKGTHLLIHCSCEIVLLYENIRFSCQ